MFSRYDIIAYDKDSGEITFIFDNNNSKKITIDIDHQYPNYEPCYNYYFDNYKKLHKIKDTNGELYLIKDKTYYTKCYQFQYDQFNQKFPLCDNGKLYRHFLDIYPKLFI